jgi:hypothetical protein
MSYKQDLTFILLVFKIVILVRGFGISLSTLSRLSRNKPLITKLALIFFNINALLLAGLKSKIKCCLLIIFIPPCSSQLTCL